MAAWADVDLSTVVNIYPNQPQVTYADGALTVPADAYFYFSGDTFEMVSGQHFLIEVTFTPTSGRNLMMNSRLQDGSSVEWETMWNLTDYEAAERIGNTVQYVIGPVYRQYEDAIVAGERWVSYESWYRGSPSVITGIRWKPTDGPMVHRAATMAVVASFDIPCQNIGQPALPNAQAYIPSVTSLRAVGGSHVQMPYKASGGSYQSSQLYLRFPTTLAIPEQFDALAEVRFVAVARNRRTSGTQTRFNVEGHAYTVPFTAGDAPAWHGQDDPASFVTDEWGEVVSDPMMLTPDDLRNGRFGFDHASGDRYLSLSMSSYGDTPGTPDLDGVDVDYAAFRVRLLAPSRIGWWDGTSIRPIGRFPEGLPPQARGD